MLPLDYTGWSILVLIRAARRPGHWSPCGNAVRAVTSGYDRRAVLMPLQWSGKPCNGLPEGRP